MLCRAFTLNMKKKDQNTTKGQNTKRDFRNSTKNLNDPENNGSTQKQFKRFHFIISLD